MLGDTAVAVHPEDDRYKHLVGKTVILPIIGREIPIVADEYVDPEFGSGAVKMTPAHDPNDFEIGLRHDLPQVLVMDEEGRMNENAGPYKGLDRFECRKRIVKDLEEAGVLVKIEDHVHPVGHSERSRRRGGADPLHPVVREDEAAGGTGDRRHQERRRASSFVPERFEKIYLHWIENVRDWCISRQLWWGHRIPAWYCGDCGEITVSREDPRNVLPTAAAHHWSRIHDVLDTWFSSALWPFSTMGWPEETEDLRRYYPTDVLVTGYDIIYFWVARMIFTALEFTGQKPFKEVLINGLVRDAEGRKMSKSLGNGVDPLEVIEQYGADAMRFMLSTGARPETISASAGSGWRSARNFANKIWNASRFALMHLAEARAEDLALTGPFAVPTAGSSTG